MNSISNTSLRQISSNWLTLHQVGIKQGTIKLYEEKTRQLNEYFGAVDIKDITYIQVQELINKLYKRQYAKSTLHKYKITLSQIFNYAMQEKIILVNPCDGVKLPKNAPVTRREPITDNEMKIIFDQVDKHVFGLYPFMLLLLGLRRSELAALCFDDIDFQNNQIRIYKIVNYVKNKPVLDYVLKNGNKERFVAMPSMLADKIMKFKNETGYVFNCDGKLLTESQLGDRWESYKASTGLTATQHMIRHTYATMLYKSEVDIKTAQYLMGHNDVRTMLQIYTHLSEEHKKKNIKKFDDFLNNSLFEVK